MLCDFYGMFTQFLWLFLIAQDSTALALFFLASKWLPVDLNVFEVSSWSFRNITCKTLSRLVAIFSVLLFCRLKRPGLYYRIARDPAVSGCEDVPRPGWWDRHSGWIRRVRCDGFSYSQAAENRPKGHQVTRSWRDYWRNYLITQKEQKKKFTNCKKKSFNEDCQETNRGLNGE